MSTASTPTTAEIESRIREIAAELAGRPADQIERATAFEADLGFDSLDRVEFIMKLEEAFDVSVPDENAERVRTVGDAVELLERTLGSAAGRTPRHDSARA